MRVQPEVHSYAHIERRLEIGVILAALATIPLTIAQVRGADHSLITLFDWLIWGVFLTECIVLFIISSDRSTYFRQNWFSAAIVVLTFPLFYDLLALIRLVRLARMMRLIRLVGVSARGLRGLQFVLGRRGLISLVTVATFVVVAGSGILTVLEPELTGAGYWSNVWWSTVTVLTLRYAGLETGWGDSVNLAMIIIGVGLRASLAASIAAYFIGNDRVRLERESLERLEKIEQRISEVLILDHAAASTDKTSKPNVP